MTLTKQKTIRRAPSNNSKRAGQHHAHNQHYVKTYWPYLPVFAVLGLGIFLNSFINRQHHSVLGYATSVSAQVLLAETNGERISNHKPALQLNTQLTIAAQAKAHDMASRNYWSHLTPEGKQPWSFIIAAGYQYEAVGENLAYGFGTSEQIIQAWMQSKEHRANLLNATYQDVGFATVNVANYQGMGPETLVVAEYGEPIGMINTSTGSINTGLKVLNAHTQQVMRWELLSNVTWIPTLLAAVASGALIWFFTRHAFAWHKVLVRGEQFGLKHPFLDLFLMGFAVLSFIFSHTAGTIL